MESQGAKVIEMNYRCPFGEIDMIAQDEEYLCFVEVKFRQTADTGRPEMAVDFRKQRKICKVADYYFMEKRKPYHTQVRFDVISILQDEIIWYKNAFPYQGRM